MFEGRRVLQLTSPQNPLIKEIRRAIAKGTLTRDGYCIAEGFHMVEEAVRSGRDVKTIVAAESHRDQAIEFRGLPVATVPDNLFESISTTDAPQGIMALVRLPQSTWDDLARGGAPLITVLDGLQDPGNAGAVVRSAEAFGASGAVFLKGTVAPYNPKAVRASAGSVFRLPILSGIEAVDAVRELASRGVELYAAMPQATRSLTDIDLTSATALVIGAEGRGVRNEIIAASVKPIHIPTQQVESLNAAVAAGILIYEAWRQRRKSA